MKNIAIITGASSGLGYQFLRLLVNDKRFDEIWIISRDYDKLSNVSTLDKRIKIFAIDLSNSNNIKDFGNNLNNTNILLLINNAGYAKFCSYSDLTIDETIDMINLNIIGMVSMGLTCLPHMKAGSHIINVASISAFQPLPYQNVYSSTKAFIKNYTRALNIELTDRKIVATVVCPGWMQTNLYDRAIIGAKRATKNFHAMVSPQKVAKKALRDAYNNKDISIYGLYAKVNHISSKIFPDKLMMKIWRIMQR